MNIDIARLRELAKARAEIHPYTTANGGIVILNGPFPLAKAEATKQYIVAACNALPGLLDRLEALEQVASAVAQYLSVRGHSEVESSALDGVYAAMDKVQALQGGEVND